VQCDKSADPASLLVVTTEAPLFPGASHLQIRVVKTPLAEVLAQQVLEVESNATQVWEIQAQVDAEAVKGSLQAETGITVIMSAAIVLVAVLVVALMVVALVPSAAGRKEVSSFFRRMYGVEDPALVAPEPPQQPASAAGRPSSSARTAAESAGAAAGDAETAAAKQKDGAGGEIEPDE
jgi:hypothetical protein